MKKILLLPLIFLMCGCWNYKELNNLAMTTGIAIDKIDNDYHVTLLISNSKKQTNDNDKPQASTAFSYTPSDRASTAPLTPGIILAIPIKNPFIINI